MLAGPMCVRVHEYRDLEVCRLSQGDVYLIGELFPLLFSFPVFFFFYVIPKVIPAVLFLQLSRSFLTKMNVR